MDRVRGGGGQRGGRPATPGNVGAGLPDPAPVRGTDREYGRHAEVSGTGRPAYFGATSSPGRCGAAAGDAGALPGSGLPDRTAHAARVGVGSAARCAGPENESFGLSAS